MFAIFVLIFWCFVCCEWLCVPASRRLVCLSINSMTFMGVLRRHESFSPSHNLILKAQRESFFRSLGRCFKEFVTQQTQSFLELFFFSCHFSFRCFWAWGGGDGESFRHGRLSNDDITFNVGMNVRVVLLLAASNFLENKIAIKGGDAKPSLNFPICSFRFFFSLCQYVVSTSTSHYGGFLI